MAWLTEEQLQEMGFKYIGENVKLSDKASYYNCDRISIGDNSRIDDFCVISGNITLEKYVHIAPHCLLHGGKSGIIMETLAGLAYGVYIIASSDDYSGESMFSPLIPLEFKPKAIDKPVTIKKSSIIGMKSAILPGVTIEEGTAIGSMSLVTKSTDPWGIYVGIPAKRIKDRKKDILELEKKFLASVAIER